MCLTLTATHILLAGSEDNGSYVVFSVSDTFVGVAATRWRSGLAPVVGKREVDGSKPTAIQIVLVKVVHETLCVMNRCAHGERWGVHLRRFGILAGIQIFLGVRLIERHVVDEAVEMILYIYETSHRL